MKLALGLVAVVLLASSVSLADPIGGAKVAKGTLGVGARDTYAIPCREEEVTRFTANGDGDGDIDCYVYDDLGNQVGSDSDSTDTCIIDIAPRWTAVFKFVIVNSGTQTDNYRIRVF